jgi:hypothetical protein
MILDTATKLGGKKAPIVHEDAPIYRGESLGDGSRPARWTYASHDRVPR